MPFCGSENWNTQLRVANIYIIRATVEYSKWFGLVILNEIEVFQTPLQNKSITIT